MVGAHAGLYRACQELVSTLGMNRAVSFPGVLSPLAIKDLMQQSTAFVQHSITASNGDMEGTPVSILEASAMGLPVISTRHGGIPEAVLHNKTGYLVEEGDEDGMANAMIKLLESSNLIHSMGSMGRKHIVQYYNQHSQIKKLYSIVAGIGIS